MSSFALTASPSPRAPVRRSATISACGLYRYELRRSWDDVAPPLVAVLLNPSTADGRVDDPTIRVLCERARQLGRGGIVVVNLFARRATDPRVVAELLAAGDIDGAIGPDNDLAIDLATAGAQRVLCAWGTCDLHPLMRGRAAAVRARLCIRGVELVCLGTTGNGEPKHPLRIPYSQPLVPLAATEAA